MSQTIPDLWPGDFGVDRRTPVAILREQAARLGEKTNWRVSAEVQQLPNERPLSKDEDQFEYSFNLRAPALGNYRYRLFSVSYGIDLYPVKIWTKADEYLSVGSEADFFVVLRDLLSSGETVRAINALLAHSNG